MFENVSPNHYEAVVEAQQRLEQVLIQEGYLPLRKKVLPLIENEILNEPALVQLLHR